MVICWERVDLLALLCVMFSCVFVTFSYGVLGQVWYLVVSVTKMRTNNINKGQVVTMYNVRNNGISDFWVYAQIRKGLGMHLVTYTNRDTVPFLLIVQ